MVPVAVTGDPPPLQQYCDGAGKRGYLCQATLNAAFQELNQLSPVTVAVDESTSLSDSVLAISWLLFDLMNAECEWSANPSGEWEWHSLTSSMKLL